MSTVSARKRDPVHDAKLNVWVQVILALPFLAIFGFTVLNIATTLVFLVMAAIRLAYPYNETLRTAELYGSTVVLVLWIVLQVI